MNPSKSFVSLKNNRKLYFVLYKNASSSITSEKPKVVVFFHGTPGTCKYLSASQQQNISDQVSLFISIERPGFGESTPNSNKTLLNFADDVIEFLDHPETLKKWLNFETSNAVTESSATTTSSAASFPSTTTTPPYDLYLMGYSGGGPFALAAAYKLATRVKKVAAVSSLCPPHLPNCTQGLGLMNRFGFWLSSFWPSATAAVLKMDLGEFAKKPTAEGFQKALPSLFPYPTEQKYLKEHKDVMEMFSNSMQEAYATGGCEEEAKEYHLFCSDWGFPVEKLDKRVPVLLIHDELDYTPTAAMPKALAKVIPNNKLILYKGTGHLCIFEHWKEIQQSLLE